MHIYTSGLSDDLHHEGDRQRKLIIQIPCLNEAESLPVALSVLPRQVDGFDIVEWLIIDDGSTDNTVEVARSMGVDYIVAHPANRGLAAAFMSGLEAAISAGADVIVNTDADNQYHAGDIPLLTGPIVRHEADIVIGARPIAETEHFSYLKKKLQALGSWAVRMASRTEIADAPSGFRAITRDTALRLNIFGNYTYTLETLIQAGLSDLRVISVPVRTNPDLRPSRLVRGIWNYVFRSLGTILRVFIIYRPFVLFAGAGAVSITIGMALGVRFLFHLWFGDGDGHIQSVVLSALLLILGTLVFMMALIADLIAVNRKLSEQILVRIRRLEQPANMPAGVHEQRFGRDVMR